MSAAPRRRAVTLRVRVLDAEAAVFGLVATTDAGAALLAQLEAQAVAPLPGRDLSPEIVAWAMERHRSVSAAARFLCVPRSTLRSALLRRATP